MQFVSSTTTNDTFDNTYYMWVTYMEPQYILLASVFTFVVSSFQAMRKTPCPDNNNNNDQRSFGDRMALEGQVSNLFPMKLSMYSALVGYSAFVSVVTGCPQFTMVAYYFTGLTLYYAWHRTAHNRYSGAIHDVHMIHHWHNFPPHDFYGDETRSIEQLYGRENPSLWQLICNTKDGNVRWSHEGSLVLSFGILLLLSTVLTKCSLQVTFAAGLMYAVMGILGTALHMSYHVRGFELEPYAWYRELRAIHFIHHLQDVNFAMVNTTIDLAFGSLKTRITPPNRIIARPLARFCKTNSKARMTKTKLRLYQLI